MSYVPKAIALCLPCTQCFKIIYRLALLTYLLQPLCFSKIIFDDLFRWFQSPCRTIGKLKNKLLQCPIIPTKPQKVQSFFCFCGMQWFYVHWICIVNFLSWKMKLISKYLSYYSCSCVWYQTWNVVLCIFTSVVSTMCICM